MTRIGTGFINWPTWLDSAIFSRKCLSILVTKGTFKTLQRAQTGLTRLGVGSQGASQEAPGPLTQRDKNTCFDSVAQPLYMYMYG